MGNENTELPMLSVISFGKDQLCLAVERGRFGHNALFSIQSKMFKNPDCVTIHIQRIEEKDGE